MAAALSALTMSADEGMWPLFNLPKEAFEQMQREGFELSYDQLYNGPEALRNCVVNFSGYCTGVVVSPDGLVFTNHHCGFESIRSHSTVEHDYMLNGFYAKSYAEELPNEDMFVSFMIEQRDITDSIYAEGYEFMDRDQRQQLLNNYQQRLDAEAKQVDSTYHVEIDPFFEGNRFYATTYQMFTDLRLVFAIPKSMGKFGGETDNWMWPRQTCDFSVFRIYADPETGGPAEYSEKNVPYHPKRWAQISMEGYKDGDYAMTIGYPGSTERYLSSYGIQEMRDAQNTPRVQVRGVKQDVMIRHMRASEAVRIKYDSKYANSSNYWKNSMGMNKCIDSIGIIAQKQDFEARIAKWQKETGYLKGKLDLKLLARQYKKRQQTTFAKTLFSESFRSSAELFKRAMAYSSLPLQGEGDEAYREFDDNSEEWDAALDRELAAATLKNYADYASKKLLPDFYKTIEKDFGGNYAAYIDTIWAKSALMRGGKINAKEAKNDPGIEMGKQLNEVWQDIVDDYYSAPMVVIGEQERYLCDAKVTMEMDEPHYSDANFTMRLSYGQVGGYTIGDYKTDYYTTAESMVEKMDKGSLVVDYEVEPIMRKLLSAKRFGRYADKTTGKMQLCLLTNNDITGGNSGSPLFDGKGRLIGLAFDGNWDSLASDINFDRQLARCISVDIRYVLFMMDKWGHADRLLKELRVKN